MSECQQQDLLLDYVYEELSPAQATALTEHLQGCALCSKELAGIRGVRGAMAELPPEEMPEDLVARMTAQLMAEATKEAARLAAAAERPLGAEVLGGGAGAGAAGEGGKVIPLRRRGLMRVLLHPASGVLAAAALALVVIAANGWQKTLAPAHLPPPPVLREGEAPPATASPPKDEPAKEPAGPGMNEGKGEAQRAGSKLAGEEAKPAERAGPLRAGADQEPAVPPARPTPPAQRDAKLAAPGGEVPSLESLTARPAPLESLKKRGGGAGALDGLLDAGRAAKGQHRSPGDEDAVVDPAPRPPPVAAPRSLPAPLEAQAAVVGGVALKRAPAPAAAPPVAAGPADDVDVQKAQDEMRAAGRRQRSAELDQAIAAKPKADSANADRREREWAPPPPPPTGGSAGLSAAAALPQAAAEPANAPAPEPREAPPVVQSAPAPTRSYGNLGRASQSQGYAGPSQLQSRGALNQAAQNQVALNQTRAQLAATLREQVRQGHCKDAAATAAQIERLYASLTDDERQLLQQACPRADGPQVVMPEPGNQGYQNYQNYQEAPAPMQRSKAAAPRKAAPPRKSAADALR